MQRTGSSGTCPWSSIASLGSSSQPSTFWCSDRVLPSLAPIEPVEVPRILYGSGGQLHLEQDVDVSQQRLSFLSADGSIWRCRKRWCPSQPWFDCSLGGSVLDSSSCGERGDFVCRRDLELSRKQVLDVSSVGRAARDGEA